MRPTCDIRLIPIISLVLLLTWSVAAAQSPAPAYRAGTIPAAWTPSPTALIHLAAVAPARDASTPELAPSVSLAAAKASKGGHGNAVALMVVGAAGIVTGLIADEDILIIAGAGVGGVGLYLYLR
jgi:hypothetical protein